MFQRMIDDFKQAAGTAIRLTSLAAMAAAALLVVICFLCAAAFIIVLQRYGPVEACLTGAAIFFVIALITAGYYMARKSRIRARAAEAAKSATRSPLADPMLVAAAIQVVRAVGIRRLVPLLAVGGLALGLMAGRGNARASDDEAPKA
ncbi:hypothetical protein [Bradyrhizobium sp. dw_78]|uniref:hypothetical protein n=1 Tax=Bradyrhizobium sp. dw_78 TaxID=2719793 RepID=UPI001BD57650|nr:hypothetical protein [Bradyrhizobium sp. dw_78]